MRDPGKIVIALDGMGGDRAPDMVVRGADIARQRYPEATFLLFGDQARLKPLVDKTRWLKSACEIVDAPDVVTNDDKPTAALRKRKSSSMGLAIEAVADGKAACVVSAGNTGALLATSTVGLRMLPGVRRPALCTFLPTMRGETAMLDLGANIQCDANNLVEFAVMGSVFAKSVLGIDAPTVGLLNVGAEEGKGNEILRDAAAMLRAEGSPVVFHGFVEGNDIGDGLVDVVVTDGFTGNVALKTIEGTAKVYTGFVRQAFNTSTLAKLGYLLASSAWKKLRQRVDPRRYNGGVFLGLNGVCVKSHGGTDELGFAYAAGVAVDLVKYHFSDKVVEELERLRQALGEGSATAAGEAVGTA
ncbi:MAG: phosphate acyltransferase PlsX [Alphaproteobacteria bacterium]|nr:phosphate acyltransferase PlsX [Alphaproteobacteria bacterium]